MKKKFSYLFLLLLIVILQVPALGAEPQASYDVQVSEYDVLFDRSEIPMPTYVIEGNVYTPIKTLMEFFGVYAAYNDGVITIESTIPEGGDERLAIFNEYVKSSGRQAVPSLNQVYFQGQQLELELLLVGGYNFVNVEVIEWLFGCAVKIDVENKIVRISRDQLGVYDDEYINRIKTYLAANTIPLELNDPSAFAEETKGLGIENFDVYLLGEQHAVAYNFNLKLFVIKYMYENYGVRYIISEDGYCDSMLVNEYLQSGDTSIADRIVSATKGSAAYSKEHYDFYLKLYEYNKNLPEDEKLCFIGIDVQHNAMTGVTYMISLLEKSNKLPAEATADLKALKSYKDNVTLKSILTKISQDDAIYRDLLEGDYIHFNYVLQGVIQGIEFYAGNDFELRERYIHENFANIYRDYEMDKCFGMFGGAHTLLNGTMGSEPNLASFIKNTLELDILSIMIDYNACEYMEKSDGKAYPLMFTYSGILSNMMAELAVGDFALYKLDGVNTPFSEDELGFTQSFQYYLSVKNSPAVTPYKPLS